MGRRRVGVRRGRLDAEGFWLKCQAISAEWRSIPSLLSARTITIIAWHFCRELMVSPLHTATSTNPNTSSWGEGCYSSLDGSRWKQPSQKTIRHLLMKNYNGVHKSVHAHVAIYVPLWFLINRRKERQKSRLFHYIIKIPGLLWSWMWQTEQSGIVLNDASRQQ